MAELIDGRDAGPSQIERRVDAATAAEVDPGAIRVTLAPTTPNDDVPPLTVGPAPVPLVMLEASTGIGILGGFAAAPARAAASDGAAVLVDGEPGNATLRHVDPEHVVLETAETGRQIVLLLPADAGASRTGLRRREVVVDGWRVEVELEAAARAALRERARRGSAEAGHSGPTEVHAIIPGVVVAVSVAPGDEVVAGQQLLAVEAMKMQNELRAPRDGTIERVAVAVGQTIEVGDLLLVIS